jgi:hypothetical protein
MMKPLGLGYQKINICPNFSILCYLKNIELTKCRTCGHARYKSRNDNGRTFIAYRKLIWFSITPRLQKLFISPMTVEHMTWHHSHDTMDGVMVQLSGGKA